MSMKSLNSKQVKILIGGLIVFVLIGLFPPWIKYVDFGSCEAGILPVEVKYGDLTVLEMGGDGGKFSPPKIERPVGYGSIFLPPMPGQSKKVLNFDDKFIGVRLDIHRLYIQWLILIALTSCILLLVTSPMKKAASGVQPIEKVASGQKLIIYSILVNLLTIGLVAVFGDIASLVYIVAIVMSFVGMFRLASGLGYSTAARILFVVLLVIPLVGLITLLVLNSRATKALREAGYKVGLFGARH